MAAISFDTLKFSKRLKDAGVPDKQAEAEAEALAEVFEVNLSDLATKQDLREVELKLEARLAETKADLIRWVVSAGIVQTAVIGALVMSLAKGG
jgi:hypothetical protein